MRADASTAEGRLYNTPNRLSQAECDEVLARVNEPRFANSSPHQIVAILADEGRYLASESTCYRILRAADQLTPRSRKKSFAALPQACFWVATFVAWYNETHRHSALNFATPAQRHRGEDREVLAQRDALYQAAKSKNPERWSGPTRNWDPPGSVLLNPGKPTPRQAPPEEPSP